MPENIPEDMPENRPEAMTEEQFWELIAASRQKSHDCESQAQALQDLLFERSAQDILAFDRIFHEKLVESYRWDLWGVVCLIQGGCSQQGFQNFCAWLIGQGHDTYHHILADPQNILSLVEEDEELLGCEALLHATVYVYDDVVGDEMPPSRVTLPPRMTGEPLSDDELAERFPNVAAVFVK